MVDTNYVGSIVKILVNPIKKIINNNILKIELRVQLPQLRSNRIINLVFWGNLGKDVLSYYKLNDYIIIEGYLTITNKKTLNLSKRVTITVLKIYPFLLSSSHFRTKE